MRPDLLPPLVIPKRRSPPPILVASHAQHIQREVERPFRPSYHSLSPRLRPSRPPELNLDDMDDIDLFNFYNPCLLPPSPIRPFPARAQTDPPANIPAPPPYSRDPPPDSAPGLRRSTYTVSRRGRETNPPRSNYVAIMPPASRPRSPSPPQSNPESDAQIVSPLSIQRSPSPFYAQPPPLSPSPPPPPPPVPPRLRPGPRPTTFPQTQAQWDAAPGPHFETSRAPPPAVAPPHRQPFAPLPLWDDASSSIYSVYSGGGAGSHIRDGGYDPPSSSSRGSSKQEEEEEGYMTPYLATRPDSRLGRARGRSEEGGWGGLDRDQVALRELWGVIDGLLGPGKNLGDYDANSVAGSMDELARAAGQWEGGGKRDGEGGEESLYGEAAWWRAFRLGLLLS